jgi:hypothetical protein
VRRRPPSEAEAGAEPWGRVRQRPPPDAEAQGWARQSFLLRLRLDLAVVSLTLAGGTAVGEGRAALFSCHVGQWKGVLDGALVIGARLLEHLVEQIGPSGRFPRGPVLGGSDKICVGGIALCLRLLLGLLLRAMWGRRLEDVFLLAFLRLLVLPEDGLDRLLTRGELGGDVHQLARLGGSLATQFAHQVAASGAGEERPDDIRVSDVGQLGALLRKPPDVVS